MGFSKCLVISERFEKHQKLKIWHEEKRTMYIYCNILPPYELHFFHDNEHDQDETKIGN